MYILVWHSQYGKEEIDECNTLKEAQFLKTEYEMAYSGTVKIKKVRA